MRVVFMGTPDFAVPTLTTLVEAGHEVVLVVAQPDRPSGRGQQLQAPPVAERARELGLPLIQPKAVRTGALAQAIRDARPDVAVVVAYGRILPKDVLDAPTHGCVNVHASLLPRWRGAAPIQAAILHGDAVTGVCTQRMEEGLDTGAVYLSAETPIGWDESAAELSARLSTMAANVAVATLARLTHLTPTPQDEAHATWAPLIQKTDGVLDLTQSANDVHRRVLAFTPWPGGQLPWRGQTLKVNRVQPVDVGGVPGTVLHLDPLIVACGVGALVFHTVQAPGKGPTKGGAFANGARLTVGAPLA
jgi:methionyl-tRNA formyltransferase